MTMKMITTKQAISRLRKKGVSIIRARATLNGRVAYKVSGVGFDPMILYTAREIRDRYYFA